MHLEGSCHCKAVRFSLDSAHPYPFNLCYCSICRKTSGSGGYAINLSGSFKSMTITGEQHIRTYHARLSDTDVSPAERKFCGLCGSALWLWDSRWPELVHPHASVIDTPLPMPPERTHLMLASKAGWVNPCIGERDRKFDDYPDESIAAWHERLGLEE